MVNSNLNNKKLVKVSQISGFTLIELMITVAIVGVLVAIVYPSYTEYRNKANRADVMTEMQQIAGRIESNKLNYRRYDKIPLTAIFLSTPVAGKVNYPNSGTALYEISVSPTDNNNLGSDKWTLTATPITTANMKGNGNLTLAYDGTKCWKTKCGMADEWNK